MQNEVSKKKQFRCKSAEDKSSFLMTNSNEVATKNEVKNEDELPQKKKTFACKLDFNL